MQRLLKPFAVLLLLVCLISGLPTSSPAQAQTAEGTTQELAPADALKVAPTALPAYLAGYLSQLSPETRQLITELQTVKGGAEFLAFYSTAIQELESPDWGPIEKSLSPFALEALSRLTGDERHKALEDGVEETLGQLDYPPAIAKLANAGQERGIEMMRILSDAVYVSADKKFNHCNVLLDIVAHLHYDQEGVKKLMSLKRECPSSVTQEETRAYVAKMLCVFNDPWFTHILSPSEFGEVQEERAGTKLPFAGAGVGVTLSPNPDIRLPLSADEVVEWKKKKAQQEVEMTNSCTGQKLPPVPGADEEDDAEPYKLAFYGLAYHVAKASPLAVPDPVTKAPAMVDGDQIIEVNGENVLGQSNTDVVKKLRGQLNTPVTITYLHGGIKYTRTVLRAKVVPDTVWTRDLGDGVYAVVISSFERRGTGFDVIDEVQKIASKARGHILFVRRNPGGEFDQAVLAAAAFIKTGTIVSKIERLRDDILVDPLRPRYIKTTWRRDGLHIMQDVQELVDGKPGQMISSGIYTFRLMDEEGNLIRSMTEVPFLGDKPAVVIASQTSASGAELFTGAVAQNVPKAPSTAPEEQNAVGSDEFTPQGAVSLYYYPTFGKFVGQAVGMGPSEEGIKATSLIYLPPDGIFRGNGFNKRIGLEPTIKVKQPKNAIDFTASDLQVEASKRLLGRWIESGKAYPPKWTEQSD
jgi:hypothetical protein